MINKKGASLAILVMVMLALSLSAITLTVFIASDNPQETILDARFVEDVYVKEEQLEFFISQLMEDSLEDMDSWDKVGFRNNSAKKVKKVKTENNYLGKVKSKLVSGEYETEHNEGKIELTIENFKMLRKKEVKSEGWEWALGFPPWKSWEKVRDKIAVVYQTDLKVEVGTEFEEERKKKKQEKNQLPEVSIEKIGQYEVSKEEEYLEKEVSDTVIIRGRASDPDGNSDIKSIEVSAAYGGKNTFKGEADYNGETGEWQVEWDTTKKSYPNYELPEGERYKSDNGKYHVVAVVEDKSGYDNYDAYINVYNDENEI